MPRRSAVDALETRSEIVQRAMELASLDGLEGVTVGRLATTMGMSKAGVIGHFGSKERLQLAAVQRAAEVFAREVWQPAAGLEPGLERLLAVCDAWVDHVVRSPYPGGCFWTAASSEFDGRAGEVRDAVLAAMRGWDEILIADVRAATTAGELAPETDPRQVVFELRGVTMGLNQAAQLYADPRGRARGRRALRRVLGVVEAPARA
jgi:AcrR family transcriptional regulator